MPRTARIDAPGALHHVTARGIDGQPIFIDDPDRVAFLSRLGAILKETATVCCAWALLADHFHLLLKTGAAPIATVMRRLQTGHAVRFNRRHHRSGHLFQNRYKSILCQEDVYLLELVRYIHLNPLRAGAAADMAALDRYPYGGHAALMGNADCDWQDTAAVLERFGRRRADARRAYREFVKQGIALGPRRDLTGGGLVRSAGGWAAVKALRSSGTVAHGDERILGDGAFVEEILSRSRETLERRYALSTEGVTVDAAADRAAAVTGLSADEIWTPGKHRRRVEARSLLCYWAVRELGETMTSMAERLGMTTAAVSLSVRRGAAIAAAKRLTLREQKGT